MVSMLDTIKPKSDQLNSDDLIGGPITVRVRDVKISPGNDQPVSVYFDGDRGKPFKPCLGMRRVLVHGWGGDEKIYPGRWLTLFRDPSVTWAGGEVGGIRISHMSDLSSPKTSLALSISKSKRIQHEIVRLRPGDLPEGAQMQDRTGQSSDAIDPKLRADAGLAAMKGSEALSAFWQEIGKDGRLALKNLLPDLKEFAAEADRKAADGQVVDGGAEEQEDGLGLPRLDDEPGDAERERALAEARQRQIEEDALHTSQDGEDGYGA